MRRSVAGLVSLAVVAAGLVAPAAAAASGPAPGSVASSTSPSAPVPHVRAVRPQSLVAPPAVQEVVVRLRGAAPRARVQAAAQALGARPFVRLDRVRAQSFLVPVGDVARVVAQLRARTDVLSVTVPEAARFFDVPTDPLYAAQQSTYLGQVAAPAAWTRTHGSAAARIAVIDSGVDLGHADLAAKVVGSYNAVTGTADVTDEVGHGTVVAGVAAAGTSNGVGIAGAGWDSSILAVKVADAAGNLYNSAITAGILWAADHGARVINLSLGSPTSDPSMADAIAQVRAQGVVVVAAAGNSGHLANLTQYPAGYPGVIAVGATNPATQARASFSQYGSWVTVAAPGVGITGPCSPDVVDAIAIYARAECPADSYLVGDGTSFAAPIVAGEAALLLGAHPDATEPQVRAAVVASAHGYQGQGLGAGLVDLDAAFDHVAPTSAPTITSPAQSAVVGGQVAVTATSTAPAVRFAIDGVALGSVVPVEAGSASASWSTFGYAGAHSVTAVDCSVNGECNAVGATTAVSVANDAPVITSPASGASLSGGFTVTADAPGGGVQVLVDGVVKGFDATAPYAVPVSTSLSDGSHTVVARTCDVGGSRCGGASTSVTISTASLHPVLVSIAPAAFSPNRDGRRDTAIATIRLPEPEFVSYSVVARDGTTVVGPRSLGLWSTGTRTLALTGLDGTGARLADGAYSLVVSTRRSVGATVLRGSTARSFRIDSTAPTLLGVVGSGTGFYPVKDGYKDAFAPTVSLSEAGTLSLVVRTTKGALVRSLSIVRSGPGRYGVAWNGKTAAGAFVPAGWYTWRFVAEDLAGNVRSSAVGTVKVSLARLQNRSVTLTAHGSAAYDFGGSDASCSDATKTGSSYAPYGIDLVNQCDVMISGAQTASAFWHVTAPAAARYTSISLSVYGRSAAVPSTVAGGLVSYTGGSITATGGVRLYAGSQGWFPLGTLPGTGRVSSGRQVTGVVWVPNNTGVGAPPFDFDVRFLRVVVGYQVLG